MQELGSTELKKFSALDEKCGPNQWSGPMTASADAQLYFERFSVHSQNDLLPNLPQAKTVIRKTLPCLREHDYSNVRFNRRIFVYPQTTYNICQPKGASLTDSNLQTLYEEDPQLPLQASISSPPFDRSDHDRIKLWQDSLAKSRSPQQFNSFDGLVFEIGDDITRNKSSYHEIYGRSLEEAAVSERLFQQISSMMMTDNSESQSQLWLLCTQTQNSCGLVQKYIRSTVPENIGRLLNMLKSRLPELSTHELGSSVLCTIFAAVPQLISIIQPLLLHNDFFSKWLQNKNFINLLSTCAKLNVQFCDQLFGQFKLYFSVCLASSPVFPALFSSLLPYVSNPMVALFPLTILRTCASGKWLKSKPFCRTVISVLLWCPLEILSPFMTSLSSTIHTPHLFQHKSRLFLLLALLHRKFAPAEDWLAEIISKLERKDTRSKTFRFLMAFLYSDKSRYGHHLATTHNILYKHQSGGLL